LIVHALIVFHTGESMLSFDGAEHVTPSAEVSRFFGI